MNKDEAMLNRIKQIRSLYLYIIFIFAVCFPATAGADTNVTGSISANTVWNLTGSPYIVTGDVTVETGAVLTVNAGVAVKFNSGFALNVSGTLNASGTATNPVIFTSNQGSPASEDWKGIRFTYNSSGTLANCVIEYAESGIYFHGDGAREITGCKIRHNKYGVETSSSGAGSVVNDSSFEGNTEYNYYVRWGNHRVVLDAKNNWWGTDDPRQIASTIYDYKNNAYCVVDFSLFLDAENGTPAENAPGGETYLIGGTVGNMTLSGTYIVPSYFRIQPDHEVNVTAGTVIKFMSGAYLEAADKGKLIAEGTAGSPVAFTSAQSSPAAEDWKGIRFTYNSSGTLANCVIEYAESGIYFHGDGAREITGCKIRHNKYGTEAYSSGSGSVVNNCSFEDNTAYNYYSRWGNSSVVLDAKNNWWGTDDPQQIASSIYDYEDKGYGVVDFSLFLDAEDGSPLVAAPGGETYLTGGTLGNMTLSGEYIVPSYFRIQPDHEVTVTAGTVIKFMSGAYLEAADKAKLTAGNTAGSPVVFTSDKDSPAAEDWKGIRFTYNSSGTLANCVIEYAESGIYFHGSGARQITDCKIRHNKYGVEAYDTSEASVVNNCSFEGNTQYNYYVRWISNTTTLDATNNWWGTADLEEINAGIYDFSDNSGLAVVDITPIQTLSVFANFTARPTSGTVPLTVQFTDRTAGSPVSWEWDFDNDGVTDSAEQNPEYTYETEGTYSVKLAVSNGTDTDDELKSDYIQVNILTAAFAADKTHGNPPLAVQFTDQSKGDITSWEWDFDNDGVTDSTEQNPKHTYSTAGVYSVKLAVSNADAADEELKTDYIRVTDPDVLTADFTASPASGIAPLTVQFTDQSSGNPASWQWDFDNDGNNDSAEQNPSFTYSTAGVYSVRLIVSNTDGDDEELKQSCIQVSDSALSPDLQVSNIQLSDNAYAGQSFQVSWTVENSGESATTASAWTDRIYLSPDAVFNEETVLVLGNSQNKNPLAPGERLDNTATFTLPDDKTGMYYVFVFADILDNQPEEDENNNSGSSAGFEIETSPASNLVAADIRAPLSVFSQTELEISWRVQNAGEWNISAQWLDRLYISSDNILDSSDTLIGEFTRSEGLGSDSDYWQTESVQIPRMPAASYYLIMETDSGKTVSETGEDDNTAVRTVTVAKAKLMTAAPDRIMLNLTPGVPVNGQIDISNIGNTAMSGISAQTEDAPSNIVIQLDVPPNLDPMTSESVGYTVTATDESVLENKTTVRFTSSEKDEAGVIFEIAVIPGKPRLAVEPGYLESGMLRGEQRTVECEITNTGGAPANDLQVLIPEADWLRLATPAYIGTLAQGEKAKIGLLLNPGTDMDLGPYTGTLSVSGNNANLRIGFRFTVVSEAKGGLKITATDEFSYFAEDRPNVAGAEVSLKDAYGDTVIAEGVTDENGMFTVEDVNEGPYELTVRAEKHGTYHSPIEVVPGVEKAVEAFLPRQLVTYNWSVVPIQIEDKYKITLEAVFETHVPAPVVTVSPSVMTVPLYKGETTTIDLTITNHGLIAANDVTINFPENDEVYVEPLIQNVGLLPAMTSVTIPVDVQAKEDGGQLRNVGMKRSGSESSVVDCLPADVRYYYICGVRQGNSIPIDWSYLKDVMAVINSALAGASRVIEAGKRLQPLVDLIEKLVETTEDLEDGKISEGTVHNIALLFGEKLIADTSTGELIWDQSNIGNIDLSYFKLTDESLDNLRLEGMPEDIISKLEIIKNIKYIGVYRFLNALEVTIGKDATEQYKTLFLEYAKVPSYRSSRSWTDWAEELVPLANDLIELCENTSPAFCKGICDITPESICETIDKITDYCKGDIELAKNVLSVTSDIIGLSANLESCLGAGNILSCLSIACNIISLNNDASALVDTLKTQDFKCLTYFIPDTMKIDPSEYIGDIPRIEVDPCICNIISFVSLITSPPEKLSDVPGAANTLKGLEECMCIDPSEVEGGGGEGGGGGIIHPYGWGRASTSLPCE
jgi:PKD repeat protein